MWEWLSLTLGGTVYLWIKSFHILAVIAWMAGLLYLPRLFVYHVSASPGGELDDALIQQERRLLRLIMNPAMIAAWVLGLLMLAVNPALLEQGWMHVKLVLIVAMTGVHHIYSSARKRFATGANRKSARYWRVINELPALLAVAVVIMAVAEPL